MKHHHHVAAAEHSHPPPTATKRMKRLGPVRRRSYRLSLVAVAALLFAFVVLVRRSDLVVPTGTPHHGQDGEKPAFHTVRPKPPAPTKPQPDIAVFTAYPDAAYVKRTKRMYRGPSNESDGGFDVMSKQKWLLQQHHCNPIKYHPHERSVMDGSAAFFRDIHELMTRKGASRVPPWIVVVSYDTMIGMNTDLVGMLPRSQHEYDGFVSVRAGAERDAGLIFLRTASRSAQQAVASLAAKALQVQQRGPDPTDDAIWEGSLLLASLDRQGARLGAVLGATGGCELSVVEAYSSCQHFSEVCNREAVVIDNGVHRFPPLDEPCPYATQGQHSFENAFNALTFDGIPRVDCSKLKKPKENDFRYWLSLARGGAEREEERRKKAVKAATEREAFAKDAMHSKLAIVTVLRNPTLTFTAPPVVNVLDGADDVVDTTVSMTADVHRWWTSGYARQRAATTSYTTVTCPVEEIGRVHMHGHYLRRGASDASSRRDEPDQSSEKTIPSPPLREVARKLKSGAEFVVLMSTGSLLDSDGDLNGWLNQPGPRGTEGPMFAPGSLHLIMRNQESPQLNKKTSKRPAFHQVPHLVVLRRPESPEKTSELIMALEEATVPLFLCSSGREVDDIVEIVSSVMGKNTVSRDSPNLPPASVVNCFDVENFRCCPGCGTVKKTTADCNADFLKYGWYVYENLSQQIPTDYGAAIFPFVNNVTSREALATIPLRAKKDGGGIPPVPPTRPRIAILSIYSSGSIAEIDMLSMWMRSKWDKEQYAARHGYDLIWETKEMLVPGRTAHWGKVSAIAKWLPHYDWVWWIDTDTVTMNMSVKLETLVELGRERNGGELPHFICAAGELIKMANTGSFLIRNSPEAYAFLLAVLASPAESWQYYEQGGIDFVLFNRTDKKFSGEGLADVKNLKLDPHRLLPHIKPGFATSVSGQRLNAMPIIWLVDAMHVRTKPMDFMVHLPGFRYRGLVSAPYTAFVDYHTWSVTVNKNVTLWPPN